MDSQILNRISTIKQDDKIAFKKKALIFGFFLVVSTAFWFINTLSDYYSTEISYPIVYQNFPKQKVNIGNPSSYLKIKVRALGYIILRYSLSSKYIPITFNVNSFSMKRLPGNDSSVFYIQTQYTRDYIAKQLSSEFEIIDIKPDTLYFRFANMRSKMLPVKPKFIYRLEKQMILKSEPQLIPDSILVSGPDYIMDTITSLETMPIDLGVISHKKEVQVNMNEIKNLYLKISKVDVVIDVEQFTEKTIQIPITTVNMPESYKLKTFPRNIILTCQVGLSNYEKLDSGFFRAQVDYNETLKSQGGNLEVLLVKQPAFIRAANFTPASVEFLIEKK